MGNLTMRRGSTGVTGICIGVGLPGGANMGEGCWRILGGRSDWRGIGLMTSLYSYNR